MAVAWLITLTLLGVIGGLVYLFLIWNFGYWKKRGVREAKSSPLVGSFPGTFSQKHHAGYDIDEIYKKYRNDEKYVGIFMCRTPQLLILDPEYIHKIYVNDFKYFHDNEFSQFLDEKTDLILANNPFALTGEKWKERRLEIVPGMTPNRIKIVYPVTLEVCHRFNDYIKTQIKMAPKDGIDTIELCLRYTSEVVSDCVLGIKAESLADKSSPIFEMTKKISEQSVIFLIYQFLVGLLPSLKYVYKMRLFPKPIEQFFTNLMAQSIDLRRQQNVDRNDFLSYLLQLQQKKNISTTIMTSHVMTFLTDGFLTTAIVVGHTLLLLAREPSKQQRLREEIMNNLDETGNLNFEQLSELPYLNACFHEALRIFAPLTFLTKLCTIPYELTNKDGKTLRLNVGELVTIPTHSLHHDAQFYENPERFEPERFLEENNSIKDYRERGMFLGFGDGPRVCLGQRFALTQGKAAIVEVIKGFKIKPNPKTRTDNYIDKNKFITTLDGGVWLDFEPIQ